MKSNKWVVVAKVGESIAAKRTDSCGDMEQLEQMDLILVSEHDMQEAAEQICAAKLAENDGWAYGVLSRGDYDARTPTAGRSAA